MKWPAPAAMRCPGIFEKRKSDLLVGKKTWGGLIGIYDYPELMDGGIYHCSANCDLRIER